MEATPGPTPDDAAVIPCKKVSGQDAEMRLYARDDTVVVLCPPGEVAVLTPDAAKECMQAMGTYADVADQAQRKKQASHEHARQQPYHRS